MIPETRVEVNKTGFCQEHFLKLFQSKKNTHGLGLITHTHLEAVNKKLFKFLQNPPQKKPKESLEKLKTQILSNSKNCLICNNIESTLKRYSFTIVYLWKKDADFKKAFKSSKGFCLNHLPILIDMGIEVLSNKELLSWIDDLYRIQEESLNRLEEEILYFTQKFDFQNQDKPWGTAKDALERTVQKFIGRILKGE
jgi:hypothetical protein